MKVGGGEGVRADVMQGCSVANFAVAIYSMTHPNLQHPTHAFVGLGANLGDAKATLLAAIGAMAKLDHTRVLRVSAFYRTQAMGAPGPDYINAVAQLQTALAPHDLLEGLQRIEVQHGRVRPFQHAPRTLDLDLLLYGDECIASPTLQVPHPHLHERAFVLVPLHDVAPTIVIPGRGPVSTLLPGVALQRIERLDI